MLRKIKDKSKKIFLRRKERIRFGLKKSLGDKLRLSVAITNVHVYAQVIDDKTGITVVSASTLDKNLRSLLSKTSDKNAAVVVGKTVAKKLLDKNITEVVFDRGGRVFHGKVKALADSAREVGLKF